MSTPDPRIEQLLVGLKADGRSSPEGLAWERFYMFLREHKQPGQEEPPVPLILAASGESDATKHRRLSEQIRWANENGCLDDAIRFLSDIPVEEWNSCPSERWYQESYPS